MSTEAPVSTEIAVGKIDEAEIDAIEAKMLPVGHNDFPLAHDFDPAGIYMRSVLIREGEWVIGHRHRHGCINLLLTGEIVVLVNGEPQHLVAPCKIWSEPGTRKIGFALKDTIWATIHATKTTDIAALEDELAEKSDAFLAHEKRQFLLLREQLGAAHALENHEANTP